MMYKDKAIDTVKRDEEGNIIKIRNDFEKRVFTVNRIYKDPFTVNAFKVRNDFYETQKIFKGLREKLHREGKEFFAKDVARCIRGLYSQRSDPAKHLIMFSGGYDSLSLALRYLEKRESVMLFSLIFDPEMVPFVALQGLILNHLYPSLVRGVHFLGNEQFADCSIEHTVGMVQQSITAFFAGRIKNEILENAETFDCAYCMNDDALSYENELQAIYENHINSRIYGPSKFPKLTFPLKKKKHIDNVHFVNEVQENKGVIFPVNSLESCDLCIDYFVVKKSLYMLLRKNCDFEIHKDNKEGGFDFGGYIFRIDNIDLKEDDPLTKSGIERYFIGSGNDVDCKRNKEKATQIISDIRKYSILTSEEILSALKIGEAEYEKLKKEGLKCCDVAAEKAEASEVEER